MIGLVMMLYPFQVGFAKPTSIMNVILEMIKPVFITGLVEKFNFDCGLVMVILFQNLVRMVDNFFMADFVSVVNYLWIRTGSIGMVISGLLLVKICLEARKSYEFFNYQYSRLRILLFVIGIGVFILLQAYVINPGQVYLERLDRFKIEDPRLEYKRLFENGVLQRPWLGYDYELIGKRVRLWKDTKDLQLRQKMETIMFPWIKPTFSSTEELRNYGEGEGIVISVPDRYVKDALSTLRMIRQVLKCDLPVEVFFLGDTDLSTNNQRLLETIPNVKTVDLNKLFDTAILNVKGFGLKPFCILGSSFNNVILIDADVVFLQSPSQLFKTKEFEQTAALFFWDRQLLGDWDPLLNQKLFIKSVLDRPLRQTVKDMDIFEGTTFNTQESGVVVIDKSKGIEALMAVCLLNVGKLREEVYKIINGDKETFWIVSFKRFILGI